MLLQSSDLCLQVSVSVNNAGIAEFHVIELLSINDNLVVSASVLSLEIKKKSTKFSVLLEFDVSLSKKSSLFLAASVE